MPPRRFPAPWSAEPQPNYYVVRDADGQQIAYVYYSNEPGRRSAAKLLTKDEARRIAANIAKLLLGSSVAQNNNERATSALRLGASGTACSRAWLELYGKSFGCGGRFGNPSTPKF